MSVGHGWVSVGVSMMTSVKILLSDTDIAFYILLKASNLKKF